MSTDPAPLVTGITAVLIGVTDFRPHLDLLCGELGFEVAAEGVVRAADAARLWGAEAGRRDVEAMMLTAAGASTGRIHLLKVDDPVAVVPLTGISFRYLGGWGLEGHGAGAACCYTCSFMTARRDRRAAHRDEGRHRPWRCRWSRGSGSRWRSRAGR
ncbi:hypothetical protein AB0K34_00115 [Actinomadura sp. NPDC049382]|uniref:hypothetical protein n=1 Tax=Actinomadura sp. NPDC049382 TaxID=3158220 RepID=UPI00341C0190